VDDNIIIAFHRSDTLETTTRKPKLNTEIVQLPELVGEPFF
jgi:hypothetical protein